LKENPSTPKNQPIGGISWGFCRFRAINKNRINNNESRKLSKEEKTWFVAKEIQQAQFMNKVNQALLPPQVKDFLRYIASKATWDNRTRPKDAYTACYASQDTIEIQMNRSRDFVTRAKKKALELGWIMVEKTEGSSDQIYPRLGKDDPTVKIKVKRVRWEGVESKDMGE
jgi:hypothetical protein